MSKVVIKPPSTRPAAADIAPFADAPTGWVVDAMGRRGAIAHDIKPVTAKTRFVGTALPVRSRPTDNLAPYAALSVAGPGDILMIATGGDVSAAVLGDALLGMAKNRGVQGVVTDGLVRDIAGLDAVGIPVFARGTTPNSPFKDGPGEVGLPVTIGGAIVEAGDLVVADADGVVVVPHRRWAEVAGALAAVAEKEAANDAFVARGGTIPDWLEAVLASDAVTRVD